MSEELEDVATDTNVDVEEATDSNEDSVEETQEDTVSREEYERLRQANLNINIARKKAEAENKKLKSEQAQPRINNNPELSEELKLIARGLSDEEIDKAKVIAKGSDITLQEAIKDPLFLVYQATLKEQEKKEKAKLGASKGSGETQPEIIGTEFGSSREEHEKAFKKVMGN